MIEAALARKPPIGRSLGSLLPQVTKKAMEKFGFPAAAILTDWPQIVGPETASFTAPERLRWPKQHEGADEPNSDGATLVLRVEGPRALEVQHRIAQLMERINAHFGFRAITEIRLLQAPLSRPRVAPKLRPVDPKARLPIPAAEIPDERLRDVLERLGEQVRQNQPPKARQ